MKQHIPHVRKSIRVLPAVIERNLQTGAEAPPIVVRIGAGPDFRERQARLVEIAGPSRVVWGRNGVAGAGAHGGGEAEAPGRLGGGGNAWTVRRP